MNLIKKVVLALAMIMVLAPMVGRADDPTPQCFPCPGNDSVVQAR